MTKRHVHLETGPVFLRSAVAFFLVRELVVWQRIRRRPLRPGGRLPVFLFRKWATPGSAGLFHLAANERVVDSFPARRKSGWSWPAGTLVCTNLRLWFFPRAHDAEIWSRSLDAREEVRLEPPPQIDWGLIADWPDRLAFQDGDGVPEVFAVADPDAVLPWFQPAQTQTAETPHPTAPPLSTPRRL
jgi:hypothetical protein